MNRQPSKEVKQSFNLRQRYRNKPYRKIKNSLLTISKSEEVIKGYKK